jgi:acyl-CoA reductase-like NAD-dependent aldehyde dehydrogenase
MEHYQKLVDDAVAKGARVLSGRFIPGKKNGDKGKDTKDKGKDSGDSGDKGKDSGDKGMDSGDKGKGSDKDSDPLTQGSFYPPTVLADVPEDALIAQEEIFGPIMCIFKVR